MDNFNFTEPDPDFMAKSDSMFPGLEDINQSPSAYGGIFNKFETIPQDSSAVLQAAAFALPNRSQSSMMHPENKIVNARKLVLTYTGDGGRSIMREKCSAGYVGSTQQQFSCSLLLFYVRVMPIARGAPCVLFCQAQPVQFSDDSWGHFFLDSQHC